jgi:serine/threonine protein kinase
MVEEELLAECVVLESEGNRSALEEVLSRQPPQEADALRRELDACRRVDVLLGREPGLLSPENPEPAPDPLIGKSLADHEILALIGEGGVGRVYLARQLSLDRPVAFKVLKPSFAGLPHALERFRRESRALAALDHKNILPVYAVGEHAGCGVFMTMPYISGLPLSDVISVMKRTDNPSVSRLRRRIREETMSREEILGRPAPGLLPDEALSFPAFAADVIRQIAGGLSAAHGRGLVHRDIKPSNILLTADGTPYLLDFGLTAEKGRQRLTVVGEMLGTPLYMAPERLGSDKGEEDPRGDIYSLGVSFYEWITGAPPFEGETMHRTLHLIQTAQPVLPSLLKPWIDPVLERIILKCLEKKPSRRYQTADDLQRDLSHWIHRRPLTGTGAVRARSSPSKRSRSKAVLAAALVVAAGSLAGWILPDHKQAEPPLRGPAGLQRPLPPIPQKSAGIGRREEKPPIRKEQEDPDVLWERGMALAGKEGRALMIASYERRPSAARALTLGELFQRQGDGAAAGLYYRKSAALAPADPVPLWKAGLLEASQGRNVDAEESLRSALARKPEELGLRLDLADFLDRIGKRAESLHEQMVLQLLSPPYADPDGLFKAKLPPRWMKVTEDPIQKIYDFRSPDGGASLFIKVFPSQPGTTLEKILRAYYETGPWKVKVLQSRTEKREEGEGLEQEITIDLKKKKIHGLVRLLTIGNRILIAHGYTDQEKFEDHRLILKHTVRNVSLSPPPESPQN